MEAHSNIKHFFLLYIQIFFILHPFISVLILEINLISAVYKNQREI